MNGVAVSRQTFAQAIFDAARMDDIGGIFVAMDARKIDRRIVPDMPA